MNRNNYSIQSPSPSSGHDVPTGYDPNTTKKPTRANKHVSSTEKKRARDRKAQQKIRDKRSSYIANLEARLEFCESSSDEQVRNLRHQLDAEREISSNLRSKVESMLALVGSWAKNDSSRPQPTPPPVPASSATESCYENISRSPRQNSYHQNEEQNAQPPLSVMHPPQETMVVWNDSWSPYLESFGLLESPIPPTSSMPGTRDIQSDDKIGHHLLTEQPDEAIRPASSIRDPTRPQFQGQATVRSADHASGNFMEDEELINLATKSNSNLLDWVEAELFDSELMLGPLSTSYPTSTPWQRYPTLEDSPEKCSDHIHQASLLDNSYIPCYLPTLSRNPSITPLLLQLIDQRRWSLVPLAGINASIYTPTYFHCLRSPEKLEDCEEIPSAVDLLFGQSQNYLANAIAADINFRTQGLRVAEKLAIAYLAYLLCKWRANPSKERYDRLPEYIRPTMEQLTEPHSPTWDLFMYPPMRANMIRISDKYQNEEALTPVYKDFGRSIRVRWDDDMNVLVRHDGYFVVHEKFLENLKDGNCWTIGNEFREKYPDLMAGVGPDQ